jgi:hypothetical protein
MEAWVGTTFLPFPSMPPNNFNELYLYLGLQLSKMSHKGTNIVLKEETQLNYSGFSTAC